MRADRWVRTHRAEWSRLEELCARATSSTRSLSDAELHEMGALYRRATADLARAQTRFGNTPSGRELVRSLNDLVLRSHSQVYAVAAPQMAGGKGAAYFFFEFAAAVRRQWRAILVASLLTYVPALLAYIAVVSDPASAKYFPMVGAAMEQVHQRAITKTSGGWGAHSTYEGILSSPETATFIMANNIKVSMNAVALGLLGGIGTAIALLYNGLMLGGLAGVATNEHVDMLFWAVILPHGILELSAICIAGGAGFVLARAIYAPGDLPRRDALRIAGVEAGKLLAGVAVMLVIAGTIEGFITPQPWLPAPAKLAFSLLTAVALGFYLLAKPPARVREMQLREQQKRLRI